MSFFIFFGYVFFAILLSAIIYFISKLVISYFNTFFYRNQPNGQSIKKEQQAH